MRWTLGLALGRRGFVVAEAIDLSDALTVLAGAPWQFDVIVLECHARRTDAARVADVRALAPDARLILTSSNFDAALHARLIAEGADVIVEKPFALDAMIELIAGDGRPVHSRVG